MNAVNLMDGLDGLAAGVCLFVSLTLFLVSLHFRNVLAMLLMSCFSGAVFGFLLFNFYPAKIFLGDSGSMLLGFLVGALSLIGSTRKAETAIALLIPVVALGVPIFDTSLTILRRWYKKFPIGSPDRQHIHHVLLSMGYSHPRAVLTLYVTTMVLGGAALLYLRHPIVFLALGLTVFPVAFAINLVQLRALQRQYPRESLRLEIVLYETLVRNDQSRREVAYDWLKLFWFILATVGP